MQFKIQKNYGKSTETQYGKSMENVWKGKYGNSAEKERDTWKSAEKVRENVQDKL